MMFDHDEYNDNPTIRHDDRIMICEAGLYLSIYIHVFFSRRGCVQVFFPRGGVGLGLELFAGFDRRTGASRARGIAVLEALELSGPTLATLGEFVESGWHSAAEL